jgi:hypothetical protein
MMHMNTKNQWPSLSFADGRASYATLHLWSQVLGKIKLATMPWINHSWGVTLYISSTGLSTQNIPYGERTFQIDLDFYAHQLKITTSDASQRIAPLNELSVAGFYRTVFTLLEELGIKVKIDPRPAEMPHATPLDQDHIHNHYEVEQVQAMHQAMVAIQNTFMQFRACFNGKISPVHLFWGGFDLSLTLFSGRKAPAHPGKFPGLPDSVLQDAYSHEICETGFSLGSKSSPEASFYCSIYPHAQGEYDLKALEASQAVFDAESGSFSLSYAAVAESADPEGTLLSFLSTAYRLTTGAANWPEGLWSPKKWEKGVVSAL